MIVGQSCNLILYCLLFTHLLQPSKSDIDPDVHRDFVEVVKSRGFTPETHYVTTEDGYILTVHRILNPESKPRKERVVIIQNGLLSCSKNFVVNSPYGHLKEGETRDICDYNLDDLPIGDNLPFELSKRGLDIWMPNSRGSGYSINHTTLNTSHRKYWKFTFDEMIKYDMPAYIEYIQKQTEAKTMGFIGYSEGGFLGLGLMADKPEYNEILKPYIGLAPVYALQDFRTAFGLGYILPQRIIKIMRTVGGKFFPSKNLLRSFSKRRCPLPSVKLCDLIINLIGGFSSELHNLTRIPVYLSFPSQTSMWNMAHYLQLILYDDPKVYKMDFGLWKNLKHYGQASPPVYDMGQITNKYLALILTENDWMVSPKAMRLLKSHLKVSLFDEYNVPNRKWSHLDFVFGMNGGKLVWFKVVDILRKAICEYNY